MENQSMGPTKNILKKPTKKHECKPNISNDDPIA
jgi:hypothetical protein